MYDALYHVLVYCKGNLDRIDEDQLKPVQELKLVKCVKRCTATPLGKKLLDRFNSDPKRRWSKFVERYPLLSMHIDENTYTTAHEYRADDRIYTVSLALFSLSQVADCYWMADHGEEYAEEVERLKKDHDFVRVL